MGTILSKLLNSVLNQADFRVFNSCHLRHRGYSLVPSISELLKKIFVLTQIGIFLSTQFAANSYANGGAASGGGGSSEGCEEICAPYKNNASPTPKPGEKADEGGQLKSACDELKANEVHKVQQVLAGIDLLAASSCAFACYQRHQLKKGLEAPPGAPQAPPGAPKSRYIDLEKLRLKTLSRLSGELFLAALIVLDDTISTTWAGPEAGAAGAKVTSPVIGNAADGVKMIEGVKKDAVQQAAKPDADAVLASERACQVLGAADALGAMAEVLMMQGTAMSKALGVATAGMGLMMVYDPQGSCMGAVMFALIGASRGYGVYQAMKGQKNACKKVEDLFSSLKPAAEGGEHGAHGEHGGGEGGEAGGEGKGRTSSGHGRSGGTQSEGGESESLEPHIAEALSGDAPDQELLRNNSDTPGLVSDTEKLKSVMDDIKKHGPAEALEHLAAEGGENPATEAIKELAKQAELNPVNPKVFSNAGVGSTYGGGGASKSKGSSSGDSSGGLSDLLFQPKGDLGAGPAGTQMLKFGKQNPNNDIWHKNSNMSLFEIISKKIENVSVRVMNANRY